MTARRPHPGVYLFLYAAFALILVLAHAPYLRLPYFWDELGQFVPAALDIFRDGALIPHSAVPNVHPPGVMLWLAGAWKLARYSILVTRSAMLLLGAAGAVFAFLLAIRLCRTLPGAPAFLAALLLLADPLFYTQSMMAQLDMPAMVFTLAGLLLFLERRHWPAAIACTALVVTKETGIILPLLCAAALVREGNRKLAMRYALPCLVLAGWLILLKTQTGYWFGDPGFTHYNLAYSLHPARIATSLVRRAYYLLVADFRWVGTVSILAGWTRGVFRTPEWRFTGVFAVLHALEVSLLGGTELERYLLPVMPIFYIAVAASWTVVGRHWRAAAMVILPLGLALGLFINPPYPFPYENNLAVVDFVMLQHRAAIFLERSYSNETIYTAWPLTAALRNPDFGYVGRGIATRETSDLHDSTLSLLDPARVRVLVLYSRIWEPEWGLLNNPLFQRFLARFYDYEPQMTPEHCRDRLGLRQVAKWTSRGQWVAVYAKP